VLLLILAALLALSAPPGFMAHLNSAEMARRESAMSEPPQRPATQPPAPPIAKPRPNLKPTQPNPVLPSDRVSLVAGFRVTEGRLEITYTVENRRDREIYVLDVKDDLSPPYFVPQSPRVRFEPPDTAVVACWREYLPPDPTIAWVHPPTFYATPVAPGQKYTNRKHLPLPLTPEAAPAGRTVCTQVRFEVAIVIDGSEVQSFESSGRSLGRLYQTALAAQRVLRTEACRVRIPMLRKE